MKTRNMLFGAIAMILLWSCEPNEPDSIYVNTAPVIKDQSFSVEEDVSDTYIIGTVTATDEVDEDKITFSIKEDEGGLFEITPSGDLSLLIAKTLDYDVAKQHTIIVRAFDGIVGRSAQITINVTKPSPTITLDLESVELYTGEMAVLTPTTTNAEELSVTWASNNETVATVDDEGNITALNAGTAMITATLGNVSATTTVTVNPNVYIAGYDLSGNNDVAVLWKNGVATPLTDGSSNAQATSVFVDKDNNVYVAGYAFINGVRTALLWKNDNPPIVLSDGNGDGALAYSVFVNDNGITFVTGYQVGNGVRNAMLWRNQVANVLSDGTSSADGFEVYVDGDDVYVAGTQFLNGIKVAKLWKNDEEIDLSDGSFDAEAHSVYVNNGNVYVAGMQDFGGSKATLWENNQATTLTNVNLGLANSVTGNGTDIYVGGTQTSSQVLVNLATLWTNGSATTFGSTSVRSVFVHGTDIYLSGYRVENGTEQATFWINGEFTPLGFSGFGESIFVK
ncbi:Ig-like domain-containing protein [Flagellimonas marina]|uniref:Ig-like domain-containing protein n=1 Tax=Flagellimonas marina TaxID=1775168 RepID=A0ABV8PNQ6_9FLAO